MKAATGVTNNIPFLILRRMRQPLLTLVVVYSVAVLGMVLIPGRDAEGNVWQMDFFHAFYFVSYTATTIGFGELPHGFTGAQRAWVIGTLYASVIAWLYAIGTMLALVQDRAFQLARRESRFARYVRRQREPFYVVCGYGETGAALVRELTERNQGVVVLERDADRVGSLELQNLRRYVPALDADAMQPSHLSHAGLGHPFCAGVAALTDDDKVNLTIAIASKLLNPDVPVVARADSREIEANMASFGTDHIIDPFDTFAGDLATAIRAPCLYLLVSWLTGTEETMLPEPLFPPREGHWVVCGYGRFGKAVVAQLRALGINARLIEANPEATGEPPTGWVHGRGTEAPALRSAGIEQAVAVVAGTEDDADNLSIIMTARELNPNLFVVARQNSADNRALVEAVHADMVMHPSRTIADRARMLLAMPVLNRFVERTNGMADKDACELVSRISAVVGQCAPSVRVLELDVQAEWAVPRPDDVNAEPVTIGRVLVNPRDRDRRLDLIPLLCIRGADELLLPGDEERVLLGDRWLFCGRSEAFTRLCWTLAHPSALRHVVAGEVLPRDSLGRGSEGDPQR